MRSKKLLSLILVLCMVMQILPVFAADAQAAETAVTSNIRYIINNDFNTDGNFEGWVEYDTNSIAVSTVADGAMTLTTQATSNNEGNNHPNLRYDLGDNKLTFNDDSQYVIETKFKMSTPTSGWCSLFEGTLKINRPVDYTTALDTAGLDRYYYNAVRINDGKVQAPVNTGNNSGGSNSLMPEGVTSAYDKWVDVKIVFDGIAAENGAGVTTREGYTITAQIEGEEAVTVHTSLYQGNNADIYTASGHSVENGFTSLDSFTFATLFSVNSLSVDYFRLYELTTVDATAALTSNAVKTDGSIDIAFTSDANITEVPANAATVKDAAGNTVKVTQTYNATAKTISLKPEAALTENAVYKVNLNTEALAESGINVTNAAEMLVVATASGKSPIKYHIYDTFDDGSVGNWKQGYDALDDSYVTFGIDEFDEEKAMKLSLSNDVNNTKDYQPNVYNEFTEELEFSEDKVIVIETRFLQTFDSEKTDWQAPKAAIKANRPVNETTSALSAADTSFIYGLTKITGDKIQIPDAGDKTSGVTVAESLSLKNKWVNVRIEFDGDVTPRGAESAQSREDYDITFEIEEEDGTTTKYTGDSSLWQGATSTAYTDNGISTDAENFAGFTSLKNLVFALQNGANTLYIDEFKLYEITADQITASVAETAQYDEAIDVTFSGADEIAVPTDAVTLTAEDGTAVEVENASYDAATKVFTITPAKKLTLGNKYKINIDGTKFTTETAEYIGEASYTVTAKDRGGLVVDYNFDDESIGNWVLNTGTCEEGTIKLEPDTTTDGSKVMALTKTTAKGFHPHQFGYAYLKLPERVKFEEGKKVVVKAKIMKTLPTGTTSNSVSVLANAPDRITNVGHAGYYSYSLARVNDTFITAPPSGYRIDESAGFLTADTNSQWVDLEIVFDGTELTSTISDSDEDATNNVTITHRDGYKVTAKVGETKATSAATSLFHDVGRTNTYAGYSTTVGDAYKNAYLEAGYPADFTAENFHSFEGIDSISFLLDGNANTVYIDSVQVKVVDTTEVSATVDDRADYNGAIEVVFDSAIADPSTAVTLKDKDGNDVAVTKAYNTDTNTLTLKPSANLNIGKAYTVNVDAAEINVPEYEYTGEAAFEVLVRGENGLIINDTFDDGSIGEWQYDLGTCAEGAITLTPDTVDGSKVMKLVKTTANGYHPNQVGNAYLKLPTRITFEEGRLVVVKARVMQSLPTDITSNKFSILANAPKDIPDVGAGDTNSYVMASVSEGAVMIPKAGSREEQTSVISADTNNQWVDIEIVFDGEELESTISGDNGGTITNRDGYKVTAAVGEVKEISAATSLFHDIGSSTNYPGYTSVTRGEGYKNAYTAAGYTDFTLENFHSFDGLDSISFLLNRTANNVYIDSVEVYEVDSYDGYAQMPAGNTVKYDEAIELKFSGVHPVLGMPEGVVTVKDAAGTKLEVTQSWDKENNILSITPAEGTFAKGTQYGVTISKNVLKTVNMNYVGTTYFTVTARDDYETAEVVIDNQFNTENDTEGWVPGVVWSGQEARQATAVAENGYLHVTIPKAGYNTGYDGSVTKLLGNGIELTEGKKIVIETKIKNVVESGLWALHLNRPEDVNNISGKSGDFNNYLLVKDNSSKNQIQVPANRLTNDPNGTEAGNFAFAYGIGGTLLDDNEHVADPATIETYNKWVKYTITITDEEIYNLHVKAEILDDNGNVTETYESTDVNKATIKTALPAYERVFGKIPGYTTREDYAEKQDEMNNMYKKWFSADRLTFGIGAVTSNPSEFYVDYIKVTQSNYERPIASVASAVVPESFEAGDTVKPSFTLKGNTGTVFNVISAKYVDGKLAGTHFEKVTAPDTNEFTHTDATGWTVDASGDVVIKAFVWDNSFVPLCEAAAGNNIARIQVYVDAKNGSDMNGTGDKASPVKSLSKAFTLATAAYNADTEVVNKSTEIILASGTYPSTQGIYVEEANITYPAGGLTIKAADGATPVIDGGVTFSVAEDAKVLDETEDAAVIAKLKDGISASNIYKIDLTGVDIQPVSYPGHYNINDVIKSATGTEVPVATNEASFDGKLMTVARYPNENSVTNLDYAYTGAVSEQGASGSSITTSNYTQGFTFKAADADKARLADWANADQALLFGFWGENWATQTVPLKSVDATNGTITTEYASKYTVDSGARYYIYNLIEEMDVPGEYFIDRNTNTMYFYMPENVKADSTISISTNHSILMTLNSNNITVDGLTFANGIRYGVAFGENSSNNVVKNCTLKNTAQSAVWMQGSNNTVTGCTIYDVNGAISIFGGDEATLTSGNNKATYNDISNFARLSKAYSAGVHLYGVGNEASHNEIYNAEHRGIAFEGQNHTISYNDIHHVCQEVDDAGAIYVGRTWIDRGNKVLNNYIHDINPVGLTVGNPVAGIFLDDHYAGAYIEGNVFANITGHGVRGNAGREHTINNNLFVSCSLGGVSLKDATGIADSYTTQKNELDASYYQNEVWQTAFPELYNIMNNLPYHSEDHTYTKNLTVNCPTGEVDTSSTPVEVSGSYFGTYAHTNAKDISNNNKLESGDDYYADIIGKNYAVTAAMAGITGFVTIDFANMGR